MVVSASKVRSLCTDSEFALICASRQPELNQLPGAELKRLALRARKLVVKWEDQSRKQARTVSRVAGTGAAAANTRLKTQVFADALKSFAARLAQLDASATAASGKAKSKPKKVRNAGHRRTRAKLRKSLAAHD